MRTRKPTYAEQLVELKAALQETRRRLHIVEEDLDRVTKKLKKYAETGKPVPASVTSAFNKYSMEMAAWKRNKQSIEAKLKPHISM